MEIVLAATSLEQPIVAGDGDRDEEDEKAILRL
jgi:hypothetical protein